MTEQLSVWSTEVKIGSRQYRVKGCPTCERDPERRQLMPPHDASARCESGKHAHCACDTCF